MSHIYVIRVVLSFEQAQRIDCEGFIDLMSRAGIIKLHRNDKAGACFDFLFPYRIRAYEEWEAAGETHPFLRALSTASQKWAQTESARLEAHGFSAVCAPEWKDGDLELKDQKLVTKKFNLGHNVWCGCGHPHTFAMCDRLNCHPGVTRAER